MTRTNSADYMDFEYSNMVGHFGVACLDGVHPSVVQECQTRTTDGNHHTYVFVFNYDFDAGGKAANWHHGGNLYDCKGSVTQNASITTTGTTHISEGTLCVNGTIAGPVDLRARGTLAGNVTLQGDLILEGALNSEGCRLQPGDGAGEPGLITLQKGLCVSKLLYIECDWRGTLRAWPRRASSL